MTDTLRGPLFDMAHLPQEAVLKLRRELPPGASFPALKRMARWAVGFVVVGFVGVATLRSLRRL